MPCLNIRRDSYIKQQKQKEKREDRRAGKNGKYNFRRSAKAGYVGGKL